VPLDIRAATRPLVMGVLNVTPDSFSDGGSFLSPEAALAQARKMAAEGADIIDIGAESTRPGHAPITAEEEMERLVPILPGVTALGVPVSVDTMKASVAEACLRLGVAMINDVWGLQHDPDMAGVVARAGAPVVIMHNRKAADPAIDIMADIASFFERSLGLARNAGMADENIVLDPGIGFGKTPQQSIRVLARLPDLKRFGYPLLIGLSRKRFIASVSPSEPHERLSGTIAANMLAVQDGASIIRVHDVAETVQALRVMQAIEQAR
jgi:dihydropteroate synthase